jgi:hypothetical protein
MAEQARAENAQLIAEHLRQEAERARREAEIERRALQAEVGAAGGLGTVRGGRRPRGLRSREVVCLRCPR